MITTRILSNILYITELQNITQLERFFWVICSCNPSNIFARVWLVETCHVGEHSPAKTGHIQEYSQIFKTARIVKKIWRIINTVASIWGKNMLAYLSLDIICSS